MSGSLPSQPTPMASPPPLTHHASNIEQEHINQALQASQTAIDAISTVVSVSSWALGILAFFIGFVALWGWKTLKDEAGDKAKQIANDRLDDYMKSDEFAALMKSRIDKAVRAERLDLIMQKIDELTRDAEDEPPFEEKGGDK